MNENKMLEKNSIIDFIKVWKEDRMINKEEFLWILEFTLGMRQAIITLPGEFRNEIVRDYFLEHFDFVLFHQGRMVISNKFNIKKILDDPIIFDDEYKLGKLLGYPDCCIKKWISFTDGIESATHKPTWMDTLIICHTFPVQRTALKAFNEKKRLKKFWKGQNN